MTFVLGMLLLSGAMFALCISLGLVQTSDSTTRARLLGPKVSGRRAKGVDPVASRLYFEGPEDAARLVTTAGMRARIERNLMLAGYPAGWTWQKIILIKIVAPVLVLFAVKDFSFGQLSLVNTSAGVVAIAMAYLAPDMLLSGRAQERQRRMELELPDALDKIVISIESGLGFEAALLRAAETGRGDFADELVRTIQDIRVGMPRRAAYESLVARTDSDDIRRFVRSIIQAEETGVSVSTVVRNQSDDMRMRRKLRAEGKAAQVSVKLLFPLIACVFPVLFVVVLAPGILTAIATFKGQ